MPQTVIKTSGRELNNSYQEKLIGSVVWHYSKKLLLPLPIRIGDFLGLMPDFLEGVSLDALAYQAAAALARREVFLLESEHIAAKPIPVEVHVRAIHQRCV